MEVIHRDFGLVNGTLRNSPLDSADGRERSMMLIPEEPGEYTAIWPDGFGARTGG